MTDSKIVVRDLYKIFGAQPQEALTHVLEGVGKTELLSRHSHVLGLQNINVTMNAGEITVIMGLSGSGKSTLIRHINRLIEPTSGAVLVDGEDVLDFDDDALRDLRRRKMSMVFQKFALLPHKTVLQNAGLSLQIRGGASDEAEVAGQRWLDRVGLTGNERQYPHQLSGGMQQRVGIARALAADTDIILMDEAFSALDPLIRTDMQNLLLELQKELHKTIVFITHDLDEALKIADHLVILKDGAVIQQGEPQEIVLNPADPYIEDFVSDINRARVLRVRSIMRPETNGMDCIGEVHPDDTLEHIIALSGGNTGHGYIVKEQGRAIGQIDMKDLVKALVPRVSSSGENRVK